MVAAMNLRQLEHVIALAEEGAFARAAQRVHLSQPALTRSIQSIEEELTAVLFDRTTREIHITPAGQIVVERARRVLFEVRSLVREVDLLRNEGVGSVDFGAGPYPAALIIPAALKTVACTHPNLRMNLTVDSYENLLNGLRKEVLDFFVAEVRGTSPSSELDVIALPRQHAGWFVRVGHPLAGRTDVGTQELHSYPIVSVPLPEPIREGLRKWLRFRPDRQMEFHLICNDVNVLTEYARQSDSLLLLASPSTGHLPIAGLVPVVPYDRPPLWVQFGIVHLAGRTPAPAVQQAMLAVQRASGMVPVSANS
jgi:DNA-binding transcriptional LysR family regulator